MGDSGNVLCHHQHVYPRCLTPSLPIIQQLFSKLLFVYFVTLRKNAGCGLFSHPPCCGKVSDSPGGEDWRGRGKPGALLSLLPAVSGRGARQLQYMFRGPGGWTQVGDGRLSQPLVLQTVESVNVCSMQNVGSNLIHCKLVKTSTM